jgi:hypothetical protein
MKKILMFSLLLAVTSNVFAIPTLTEVSAIGTTVKFTTKLSEKLPTGYKVKIDYGNGKGFVAMTCSGLACSLSSNALPKLDSPTYKIGIYDSRGVLQGTTTNGSYVIVSTAVTVTTGYTKISNSGAVLPDTATLGSGANDWACTKDNKTGLTWEVKTDDGGLRDKDWYYSWYKPIGDNGGNAGYTDTTYGAPNCSTKDNCNTDAFTNAVNTKGLCGKNDWRMPTIDELKGLLTTESTINQPLNKLLNIDANYFPNTSYWYWSSSPYAGSSSGAWFVDFYYGYSGYHFKYYYFFVRLVR